MEGPTFRTIKRGDIVYAYDDIHARVVKYVVREAEHREEEDIISLEGVYYSLDVRGNARDASYSMFGKDFCPNLDILKAEVNYYYQRTAKILKWIEEEKI